MTRRISMTARLPLTDAQIEKTIEENERRGFDSSGNPIGMAGIDWFGEDVAIARQIGDIDMFRELAELPERGIINGRKV